MPFPSHVQDNITKFFAAIEPVKSAYRNDSFVYFAAKKPGGMVLVQGSLLLNLGPRVTLPHPFASASARAGHFYLADIGETRDTFLKKMEQGTVPTPQGNLIFAGNGPNGYGGQYVPFHQYGLQTQSRLGMLSILGQQVHDIIEQPDLDWELRAASPPYDGLSDLLSEYQLGTLRHATGVDVAAFAVAAVDASSVVNGETAHLKLRLAAGLDTALVTLGYRVLDQNKVIERKRLTGVDFAWAAEGDFQIGSFSLPVPRAALLHTTVAYNNHAQQFYWVVDPSRFQNPRRASYQAFDANMETLKDILAKGQTRSESKNFEASIAWLFWMLGFAPAFLGGTPRTTDAADIVMCTPNGHFVVVEVTVGLLKAENKLALLHQRAQAVRRSLDDSNHQHQKVLPVIVTALPSADIQVDLEQAQRWGIHVVAREELEQMLTRVSQPMVADAIFERAERDVQSAIAVFNQPPV